MPKLSNLKLAQLGRDYLEARTDEQEAKARKAELGSQLMTEPTRRKVGEVVVNGVRIVAKASTTTSYGVDRVKKALGRKASRFIVQAVDTRALKDAARAGEISAEQLGRCVASSTAGSAYPVVTDLEAKEA